MVFGIFGTNNSFFVSVSKMIHFYWSYKLVTMKDLAQINDFSVGKSVKSPVPQYHDN